MLELLISNSEFRDQEGAQSRSDRIPALSFLLGEGDGNPLQYSCLKNKMDRGAWQATVHGVTESDKAETT